jgi:hypothetical protein
MISPKLKALIQSVVDYADDTGCDGDLTVTSSVAIAALAAYAEPMSQEGYVETGGSVCPHCHGEEVEYDGNVRLHQDRCYHDCKCDDCLKEWTEEYTLVGYE